MVTMLKCPKCKSNRIATRVNPKGEIILQCWRCGEMKSGKDIKELIKAWQKMTELK